MYYQKSVLASNRDSSVVNKSMARRTLAASYFVHEPQDIVTGRRYFEEALAVLEGGITTDFYSIYTKVLTCREWSGQEAWFGSKESAQERLSDAMRYVMMLPDWYPLKAEEIRLIANGWRGLGNSYFQTAQGVAVVNPDWGGARAAYQNALDVLQALRDENSVDLCGQIRQDWAYNEMLCGSRAAGEQQIASAVECYRSLSDEYPRRAAKLKALEDMAAALEQRLAQPPPTDERGPPAARRGLEPRVAYEPTSLARESILPTLGPTVPAPERRG